MPRFDIVSLGEPLYELNRQPDGRYLAGFGGDTLNVAIAASRLGSTCAYVTRLGGDVFGDEIHELMIRERIDASAVQRDADAPTGLYFVTHGPQGHVFTYRRKGSAASLMRPADLDPSMIRDASFLHASGISQAISASAAETVAAAIGIAKGAGVRVSFDTNFRPRLWSAAEARPVIGHAAAQADILKTSAEDCDALIGITAPQEIATHFLALGAKAVIVTLGREGVMIATASGTELIPGHPVKAVDATGAGDAFTGAMLSELARGQSLPHAARFANVAAALSTLGYGAIAPLPQREAVEAALHVKRSRVTIHPIDLDQGLPSGVTGNWAMFSGNDPSMPAPMPASDSPAAERLSPFARNPLDMIASAHALQVQMCDAMERIADGLPDEVDRRLCAQVASCLQYDLPLHHHDEEEALFPLLRKRALPEDGLDKILERLAAEHDSDTDFASEIAEALETLGQGGRPANPEMLGYMLRGFFERYRRHVHWENTLVMPLARLRLTPEDLDILQATMTASRHHAG